MRIIIMALLGFLALSASAHEPKVLTNLDVYKGLEGEPAETTHEVGSKVRFKVVCVIARDVPVVDILFPEGFKSSRFAGYDKPYLRAHLLNSTYEGKRMKKGESYVVEGVLVNGGFLHYGAYFVYMENYKAIIAAEEPDGKP